MRAFLIYCAVIFIIAVAALTLSERNEPLIKEEVAFQIVPARDYQLQRVEDSILVYDGKRYVGAYKYNSEQVNMSPLDSLLNEDNH